MIYLLSKAVTLVFACLLAAWLFKPRLPELAVLGVFVVSVALRNLAWLGDDLFGFGRPEWFRLSIVWFETLAILAVYLVLRFRRTT